MYLCSHIFSSIAEIYTSMKYIRLCLLYSCLFTIRKKVFSAKVTNGLKILTEFLMTSR